MLPSDLNPFVAASVVDSDVSNLSSCVSRGPMRASWSVVRATVVGHGCVETQQLLATGSRRRVSTLRCHVGRSLERGSATSAPMTNRRSENESAVGPMVTNIRMCIDSSIREAKTTVKG